MKLSSFRATMGAGIAVGALGVMMLPKNGEAYKFTKDAAKTIKQGGRERHGFHERDALTDGQRKSRLPVFGRRQFF